MNIFRKLIRKYENLFPSFEERLFWLVSALVFLQIIFGIITGLAITYTQTLNLVLLISLLIKSAICITAFRTGEYAACYTAMCLEVCVLILPATFLLSGGFDAGAPVYMILGSYICAIHFDRKLRLITSAVTLAAYGVLFVLAWLRPELIHQVENPELDVIVATALCAFSTVTVISFILNNHRQMYNDSIREYRNRTGIRMDVLEAQVENMEEVKKQRKTMRDHNMIIAGFAEKGDFDGLIDYLSEKEQDEADQESRVWCRNAAANNILSGMDRIAKRKGIRMTVKANLPERLSISEPELVMLISNILENAINGAENSGRAEKKVMVDLHTRDSKFILICDNTCRPDLEVIDGFPGYPGIGIGNVNKVLNKYGGLLDYGIVKELLRCRLIVAID